MAFDGVCRGLTGFEGALMGSDGVSIGRRARAR